MSIVLISCQPHGAGKDLARNLAKETGWPLYSRTQVAEKAHETGIRLSRLETSVIKAPVITEKLAREKELYLSLVTKTLCEKASSGNLIYYGRAAHLLLPGTPGVVRVGVDTPFDTRADNAAKELNISRDKAVSYLNQLDDDIEKWVHYVHRDTLQNPSGYDFFLNLTHLPLDRAVAILNESVQIPTFKLTTRGVSKLDDRCLAASAKLHLANHSSTRDLNLGVRAVDGKVTVTYMPRQKSAAPKISKALKELKGCRETICTMAETNILWIEEAFDPRSEDFDQVVSLAKRWGAAVELLELENGSAAGAIPVMEGSRLSKSGDAYTGGVEDDDPAGRTTDNGLSATVEKLVAIGRSAGGFGVSGGGREILEAVRDNDNYSLIVLGHLFRDKGHQTSTRATRELGMTLKDTLKAPVISADELKDRFLFGKTQALKLLAFILVTLVIYGAVFTHQETILNVLGGDLHQQFKWGAAIGVALLVPVVAYIYGTVSGLALKFIGID